MNVADLVLVPVHGTGRGRLVRTGRTVLLTASDSPAAAALVGWARLVGGRPADEVLDELTRLAGGGDAFGPFCALVLDDDGVELLAHASAPVVVRQGTTSELIRAEGDQRLTRRSITNFSAVELLASGGMVDPVLALDGGVVAADGFSLRAVTAAPPPWGPPVETTDDEPPVPVAAHAPVAESAPPPAPAPTSEQAPKQAPEQAPAPAPAPQPEPMPQVVSLAGGDDDLPPAQPLPVAASIVAPAPETAAPSTRPEPKVQGVRCSRDHFNDPRARYCGVCGIAMHQASFILVEDTRPPLGVLVFSDGSYHTISDRTVIGRDTTDDPLVRTGEADALSLNDPTSTLSRVHAELRLTGWDVHIVDRGSTNGTFVWSPGQAGWERLTPNEARILSPGMHVAFGRLSATFESSLRTGG